MTLEQVETGVADGTLEEGLEQTIAFFRDPANLARYKTAMYNI